MAVVDVGMKKKADAFTRRRLVSRLSFRIIKRRVLVDEWPTPSDGLPFRSA